MEEKIILVDKKDQLIGTEDKLQCHLGKGVLHRAFSIFILNGERQFLLQQRSKNKMLWPLYWSNTCCSHPRINESYQEAAERRLKEELGFSTSLKVIGRFQYKASYKNIGSENEVCAVLIGKYLGKIKANKEEVANWKWVGINDIKKDLKENSNKYTPWFGIAFAKVVKMI